MIVSVLYTLSLNDTFDIDYYIKTHIPLVKNLWGPFGLQNVQVLRGTGLISGAPSAYHLIALLDFISPDAFQSAAEKHGAQVLGDVPNFTNGTPIIQFNECLT